MPVDRDRVERIFHEAAARLAPEERSAYLDHECGDDVELRTRVEALLAAHTADDRFLPLPDADRAEGGSAPAVERPGDSIGPYKLVQVIGEGGFGTVFLAEQEQPIRRHVALKVVKLGMDTRQVITRFEQERQALALMDHPNIARVLDAGATAAGRPYFVMELVRGEPITQYCDSHNLNTTARLELCAQVCHAVQHAHQKGVIHRDIKPSNVLVTVADGRPIPKVIDFGIAKATGARLTEKTLFTEHRQLIGTPAYMSPEQAELTGVDIDTRSDVYSLGVLLYELLTGTTPFDPTELRAAAFAEIQRIIREVEPPRPSTRVSTMKEGLPTVAAHRHTEPHKLSALIRGDLDWIVMKCLEKDRTRRYETVNALAMELQRYLNHEPVLAGPPSAAYRLRKFVRRNRSYVLAAALLFAMLLVGVAGTTSGLLWALRERSRAEGEAQRARLAEAEQGRERERADREATESKRQAERADKQRASAERIADFMGGILEGVKASKALGRDTAMLREMLDAAIKRIAGGELKDSPEAEFRLRWILGETYVEVAEGGAAQEAEKVLSPMIDIAQRAFGAESEQMSIALNEVALCLDSAGRPNEALPKYEAALAIRERLSPGDDANKAAGLSNLALCLSALGRPADALPKFEAALAMRQRLFTGDSEPVAESLNNLGLCLDSLDRYAESLTRHQAAFEMLQRLYPGDHPHVAQTLCNVAYCLNHLDRSDEALPKFVAALEMRRRVFKGDHPDVAQSLTNLGFCQSSLGRDSEALASHKEAVAMLQRLYPGDSLFTAATLANVADTLCRLDRPDEALSQYGAALQMQQRLFGGDNPDVARSHTSMAQCLTVLGRLEEALASHEAALAAYRRVYEGDDPHVATALNNVAAALAALKRPAEAVTYFEAALAMFRRLLQPGQPDVLFPQIGLGGALIQLRRFTEAEPLLLDAAEQLEGAASAPARLRQRCYEKLAELYETWHTAEPDAGYDAKAEHWRSMLPTSRPATSQSGAE